MRLVNTLVYSAQCNADSTKSIAQLLHSAGLAIKCLTLSQDSPQEIQTSKDAFTTATQSYLDQLHSVNTQFKRNAVALRQAGIIPDGRQDDDYVDDNAQMGFNNTDRAKEKHKINVDVGWLNSRSGKVGVDYEAELWAKARRILEEVEDKNMGKNQANT